VTPAFADTAAAPAQPGPLSDFLAAMAELMHRFLYMPERASSSAGAIDALQFWEFVFFWLLRLATLGAGAWFAWHYGEREDAPPRRTPEVRAPLSLEIGIAATLLIVFVLFWVVGYRQYVEASLAPPDALRVYVTGKQWVWKFAYPEGPTSAGTLFVPIGRPVRLILTSRDVIHSFFVPDFRLKQDAVPGHYTSTWFTATRLGPHQVLCAEYCGAGHSRMWGEVDVLSDADFERWLAGAPVAATGPVSESALLAPEPTVDARGAPADLVRRGLDVSGTAGCLRCHSLDGAPGLGPTWAGLFGTRVVFADGDSAIADDAYLTESMMDPQARIVAGFQPIMPTFQGRLAPGEVAGILELIRSLAGGDATVARAGRGDEVRR
jgi:cytochrome c oxidase subunit 2